MKMDRRTFLKTLSGASGSIALVSTGVTSIEPLLDAILLPEKEIKVATRSYGNLGAIRINRRWFSLEDATFTTRRTHAPVLRIVHPTIPGRYDYVTGGLSREGLPLVQSPIEGSFFVREDPYLIVDELEGEVEIEIDTRYTRFNGSGYFTSWGSTNFIQTAAADEPPTLYYLNFEATKLLRI